MLLSLWSGFWNWGGTPPTPETPVTKGGISEYDYKRYRKHLLEVQKAAEKRDELLYKKKVVDLSKRSESTNKKLPTKIENKIADIVLPTLNIDSIDFKAVSLDLQKVIAYIDIEIKSLMQSRQQDQFEEELLLLHIN